MTAQEAAIVRDLRARLLLAEEDLVRERQAAATTEARLRRRITYLERDKQSAITRARKATDAGRYWHGLALVRGSA